MRLTPTPLASVFNLPTSTAPDGAPPIVHPSYDWQRDAACNDTKLDPGSVVYVEQREYVEDLCYDCPVMYACARSSLLDPPRSIQTGSIAIGGFTTVEYRAAALSYWGEWRRIGCSKCGKQFTTTNLAVEYCSDVCNTAVKTERERYKNMLSSVHVPCVSCGVHYWRFPGTEGYCSPQCNPVKFGAPRPANAATQAWSRGDVIELDRVRAANRVA